MVNRVAKAACPYCDEIVNINIPGSKEIDTIKQSTGGGMFSGSCDMAKDCPNGHTFGIYYK